MKAVRTQQRYKCDFCKRRGTKAAMQRHERQCFRNPNRYCDNCKNTGQVHLIGDGINEPAYYQPCVFCEKLDKTKLAAIEKWEKTGEWEEPLDQAPLIPF